jgi:membrane-associated phospholipid phosphatase
VWAASLESVRSWRIEIVALAVLAAVVRIAAYDIGPVQRADLRVYESARLTASGSLHAAASAVVVPFDPLPYALIVAVLVGSAVLRGRRPLGVAAAVLMLGAAATAQLLKPLLSEARPQGSGQWLPPDAWPSGHTTAAAALAVAIVLLTPPGRRRPVALAAAVGTAVVAAALVGLGSHYPSDVIGGLCVAGVWGVGVWHAAWRLTPAGV